MGLSLWPTLQCCFTALMVVSSCSFSKVPPGGVNQVEVLTLTGPLKHPDSFLRQPFCCRFVDVLENVVLWHDTILI